MLHFLGLTINNFGPYKDTQVVDFSSEEGVTIIWGNNGFGKTILLNAFRYALFGKVQGRGAKTHSLKQIANWDSYDSGIYGFKVMLKMKSDSDIYELTRQFVVRSGVSKPKSDADYKEEVFLKKGATILSSEECKHILNNIMAEQVSRFFLFDGELLQEYEDLLAEENSTGAKIKEAIERILGVPVLTNGLVDVRKAEKGYGLRFSKAAQKNNATQQLGIMLAAKQVEQKSHEDELTEFKVKIGELHKERLGLEEELQQTDRIRVWMLENKTKKDIVERKKAALNVKLGEAKKLTRKAWQGMLSNRIAEAITQLNAEIKVYEDKKTKHLISQQLMEELKKGCEAGKCPLCERNMDATTLFHVKEKVATYEVGFENLTTEEKSKFEELQWRRTQLNNLTAEEMKIQIKAIESAIGDIVTDIADAEQRINELNKNIRESGRDTTRAGVVAQEHAKCLQKIESTKEGITKVQNILIRVEVEIKKLEDYLKRSATGNTELNEVKKKLELCEKIRTIFEKGVDLYRDSLKQKVEKDASDIFLSIANQEEYIGLRINENYGLVIVHKGGRTIGIERSAGYEHIVALSLIGALHKNAPLQGPIIMDSPFGRLDPDHKKKITSALPKLAEQVVLLIYRGEIDEQLARTVLGSDLKNEYTLVSQSAFHTNIVKS